jgi:hypothetical protein
VSDAVQGSDHLLIEFDLTISINIRKVRKFRQGDWDLFSDSLDRRIPSGLVIKTTSQLEREADRLSGLILECLDESHPMKKESTKLKPFKWWDHELSVLKKKLKHAFSYYRKQRTAESHDLLTTARRNYSKALRRAKRKSWQQFCNEASSIKQVALINKIVKGRENNTPGILHRCDGTMCGDPVESMLRLVNVHFPGNEEYENDDEQITTEGESNEENDVAQFITEDKVREAIKTFGDFKSPGPDGFPPIVLKKFGKKAISWLTCLYKASVRTAYLPKVWTHS